MYASIGLKLSTANNGSAYSKCKTYRKNPAAVMQSFKKMSFD